MTTLAPYRTPVRQGFALSPDEILSAIAPQLNDKIELASQKAARKAIAEARKSVWYAGVAGGLLGAGLVWVFMRK